MLQRQVRNYCFQDKELELNDGTTKIFLCSDGTLDDVSPNVRAFLDYMKGLPVNDEFVNEVDNFIKEIKVREEERKSYMTYEMKLMEAHNDGKAEGRAENQADTAIKMLKNNEPIEKIIEYTGLTEQQLQKLTQLPQ